jgi:alpha-L-rhamnosidase
MPSLGGNIAAFHSQALGGIRPDPTGPGFKKIIIKPSVVGGLHWVENHYDSVHGRIVSHWRKRGGQWLMEVTIPANTSATVFVPAEDLTEVSESGKPANSAAGVKFLRRENRAAVYAVESGDYRFQSTLPQAAHPDAKPDNP